MKPIAPQIAIEAMRTSGAPQKGGVSFVQPALREIRNENQAPIMKTSLCAKLMNWRIP